jgi:transcription elongation GreA/GreB family factor
LCRLTESAEPEREGPIVRAGSRVRIRESDGRERLILMRDDDAESWALDGLSTNSPLGAALLGRHVGEEVEVILHAVIPVRRVKIEAIE